VKVYVLEYADGECGMVAGVFATLEAAQAARPVQSSWHEPFDWSRCEWRESTLPFMDRPEWRTLDRESGFTVPCYTIEAWALDELAAR
jgi:hypothetical protein